MKNTSNILSPEKTASQLFNSWSAVIHFLAEFSWKSSEGNALHICGMKSGKWQVKVESEKEIDNDSKKTRSYGIGLHDLSW